MCGTQSAPPLEQYCTAIQPIYQSFRLGRRANLCIGTASLTQDRRTCMIQRRETKHRLFLLASRRTVSVHPWHLAHPWLTHSNRSSVSDTLSTTPFMSLAHNAMRIQASTLSVLAHLQYSEMHLFQKAQMVCMQGCICCIDYSALHEGTAECSRVAASCIGRL